jgi:hypothetical protein
MRKSFDGLSGLVASQLEEQPTNGDVFIFINKPRPLQGKNIKKSSLNY